MVIQSSIGPLAMPVATTVVAGMQGWLADFTTQSMPAGAVLVRASSGSALAPAGMLLNHLADRPRYEADGLLLEGARTNLLLRSAALTASPWAGVNQSAASGQPDIWGGSNGWLLTGSASNSRVQQSVNITVGAPYTFWLIAAAGTSTTANLAVDVDGTQVVAAIDFAAGTIASTGSKAALATHWQNLGGNKRKVGVTFSSTSGTTVVLQIKAGIGTLLVDAAQCEAGAVPTSYIETTTATATRAADLLTLDSAMLVNPQEGTFLAEVKLGGLEGQMVVWQLGDNTNSLRLMIETNGRIVGVARVSGTDTYLQTSVNTAIAGGSYRIALAYMAGELAMSVAGGNPIKAALTIPASLQNAVLYGGNRLGADRPLNGHVRRLGYQPRRMSDVHLKTISQKGEF